MTQEIGTDILRLRMDQSRVRDIQIAAIVLIIMSGQ